MSSLKDLFWAIAIVLMIVVAYASFWILVVLFVVYILYNVVPIFRDLD